MDEGLFTCTCKCEQFAFTLCLFQTTIASPKMKTLKTFAFVPLVVLSTAWALPGFAADTTLQLVIKNHQFQPVEIKAPAGQKLRILVHNQDSTPEEFESHSLKREKIIPGGAKATILVGPLKPGRYEFFGEFNPTTAKGTLVIE